MNGERYFSQRASGSPSLAKQFARADAELDFAQELRAARERRGLTQQQLAERMGIRQSVVARLEQAGRTPCLPTLMALGDALDAEIRVLPNYKTHIELRQPASTSERRDIDVVSIAGFGITT